MFSSLRAQKDDVFFPFKREEFPDGFVVETAADRAIFRSEPLEPVPREAAYNRTQSTQNIQRSARRAKSKLRSLAHCAPLEYFVTFTLDKNNVDRYDFSQIVRKFNTWADNNVRRRGLVYIIVPERHKDGAIHFHGLINDALEMTDSGTVRLVSSKRPRKPRSRKERERWLADGGQVVYNCGRWTLGFSTAIRLYGDRSRAISYVCKYIGKQVDDGKVGGRWYYHGGHFDAPVVKYYDITARDTESMGDDWYTIPIPAAGLVLRRREYWEVR